jgi:myosin heavy subunit
MSKKSNKKLLINKTNFSTPLEALQNALQESNQRIKYLELQNKELKEKIQKLQSSAKKRRQVIKSQQGQLKAAKIKIQKLKSQIKKVKRAARPKTGAAQQIKSVTHRTRAQYLEEVKPQFIERFIRRINDVYPDWKPEWDAMLRRVLMSMHYDEIDGIMMMLGLDRMYYESQSYTINRGATGKALYEYFVQFENR